MDQGHGDGWDPSNFADGTWSNEYGGAFEQTDGLYRPFAFYDSGDVWSGHAEASPAPYGYDQSFGNVMVNGAASTPDGYHQGSVAQWQGQAQPAFAPPALSASTSVDTPPSFFSGSGSEASMPTYQAELHQQGQMNTPQIHAQFAAALNGQPQHTRVTAAQTPGVISDSIHVGAQQPAQQPTQQPAQQPAQRVQVLQQSERPFQHSTAQTFTSQSDYQSQAAPSNNAVADLKRSVAPDSQNTPVVAKKAKVDAPEGANTYSAPGSPLAVLPPRPDASTIHEDTSLMAEARGRNGATWGGVPNLAVGPAPVQLQHSTPTKRYVTLATKGGRDPLFPMLWRGWTPAECLGNHADAYRKATSLLDLQRANVRLDIEMERANAKIPADWQKKLPETQFNTGAPNSDNGGVVKPVEPILSGIEAVETLRLHPAHLANSDLVTSACAKFAKKLLEAADPLFEALKSIPKGDGSSATAELGSLRDKLVHVINEVLKSVPSSLLADVGQINRFPVRLRNLLIRLINAGEVNSPVVKAIFHLYTRFTKVKSEQLEAWGMGKIRDKVNSQGDDEAKALIAQVYETAERNSGEGGSSNSDTPSTAENASSKKRATQAGAPPKREISERETKKTAPAKPATATTNGKKFPTTTSTTAMASDSEPKKVAGKPAAKVAPASTGTKRSREDDAAAGELPSSKKPANDTLTPASTFANSVKSTSAATKISSTKSPAATQLSSSTKSSTGGTPTTAQTKPRSGLLLPGKARPISKPTPKSDPAKLEPPKTGAKPDSPPKTQPTKSAVPGSTKASKPKPAESTKEMAPSAFSALMAEIDNGEKANKPEPSAKAATPAQQPPPAAEAIETPEQRERRLRKEQRRALNLRVTFKSGEGLTEIKEFTRHPEEIAEQQGHMARNVKTDGRIKNSEESEMMKKLHSNKGVKAEDVNDKWTWKGPKTIDFAKRIPQEKREQTYDTRGGLKTFETEEQKLIKERESTELMAVYHTKADIPPNPRSPPYEPSLSGSGDPRLEIRLSPGTPEYPEMMQRTDECTRYGTYYASRAAQQRLETKARLNYASYHGAAARQPDAPVQDARTWYDPATASRRDQQTYELLTSDRVKNWKDPNPYDAARPKTEQHDKPMDPKLQMALNSIEAVVQSMQHDRQNEVAQAAAARAAQPILPEVAQPAVIPTTQPAQAAAPDYSAAWAQYYAAQQQHQQSWYGQQIPYAAYLQQPAGTHSTQPANNQIASILAALQTQQPAPTQAQYPAVDANQVQTLLAALANGNQAQAAAPTQADPQNQYLLEIMKLASAAQNQGQAQSGQGAHGIQYYGQTQAYPPAHQEHPGYGRLNQDNYGSGSRDPNRGYRRNDRGGGARRYNGEKEDDVPEHLRGINRALIGTKQCAFWARGQCAKGDKCTFRHD